MPAKITVESNPDLLYRIPVTANSILEIGCGSGGLGKVTKGSIPFYVHRVSDASTSIRSTQVLDHVIEVINREFNINGHDIAG